MHFNKNWFPKTDCSLQPLKQLTGWYKPSTELVLEYMTVIKSGEQRQSNAVSNFYGEQLQNNFKCLENWKLVSYLDTYTLYMHTCLYESISHPHYLSGGTGSSPIKSGLGNNSDASRNTQHKGTTTSGSIFPIWTTSKTAAQQLLEWNQVDI